MDIDKGNWELASAIDRAKPAVKEGNVIGTGAADVVSDNRLYDAAVTCNGDQDNDSIFHPAVQFRYDYGKMRLSLERERGQLRDAPYTSSFFNVDFSSDLIRWDLKSDSMNLITLGGNNQAPMIIESVDYYHPDDYRLLSGQGFTFHPLAAVVNYAEKNGVREFYVDDLARVLKKKFEEVKIAMTFLSQKGMINFNAMSGTIQVKEKAIHFFDSNRMLLLFCYFAFCLNKQKISS